MALKALTSAENSTSHTATRPTQRLILSITFVTRMANDTPDRSEEHTSELQSRRDLVCRLLLEKKKKKIQDIHNDFVIKIGLPYFCVKALPLHTYYLKHRSILSMSRISYQLQAATSI